MRDFLDRVLDGFFVTTLWNRQNSYSNLNATVDGILCFEPPRGFSLALSSLATSCFYSSYELGSGTGTGGASGSGAVDGSLAYLYTSVPLRAPAVPHAGARLKDLLATYRPLVPLAHFRRRDYNPSADYNPNNVSGNGSNSNISLFANQKPLGLAGLSRQPWKYAAGHGQPAVGLSDSDTRSGDKGNDNNNNIYNDNNKFNNDNNSPNEAAALATSVADSSPVFVLLETATAAMLRVAKTVAEGYRSTKWMDETMVYGRMYLPQSRLEAQVLRRITPTLQGQLRAVSQDSMAYGGTALGLIQFDNGKFGIEGLASTDGGFLGLRGLYNIGGDSSDVQKDDADALACATAEPADFLRAKSRRFGSSNGVDVGNGHTAASRNVKDRIYGRSSVGAEIYYGLMNKSGGMSIGARFSTLPSHIGVPLTATATCNPLMGNISCSYAVNAGPGLSIASRFDWNIYSYESAWTIGFELWRKRELRPRERHLDSFASNSLLSVWNLDALTDSPAAHEEDVVQSNDTELGFGGVRDVPEIKEHDLAVSDGSEDDESIENLSIRQQESILDFSRSDGQSTPPHQPITDNLSWNKSERSMAAKLAWKSDEELAREAMQAEETRLLSLDPYIGVLKARIDQNWRVGLVWEARAKSLLFSIGTAVDLRNLDQPFRALGLAVSFAR